MDGVHIDEQIQCLWEGLLYDNQQVPVKLKLVEINLKLMKINVIVIQ
jgi:hypothetical protein